jgi:hypothetical protein
MSKPNMPVFLGMKFVRNVQALVFFGELDISQW